MLISAFIAYQMLDVGQWLSVKALATNIDKLRGFEAEFGFLGPAVFFVVASIAIVINVPTAIVIAIAAMIYGPFGAIILGTLCFSLAIVIMFYIAKVADQGLIKRIIEKYLPRTNNYIQDTNLHTIINLRLIFFALPPINWMLAILCTRFSSYFWGSVIGALPNIVVFSWLGGTLVEVIREGRSLWFWNTPELIAPTALGISLAILSILLKKKTGGDN
ncbi:MAG: VTT domain-containing protein [Gammaproteobacteria bacterium]|nr:VTT domain-containing protein [Gammaproteobacteria bacterium]